MMTPDNLEDRSMFQRFRNLPIKHKITALILLASTVTLLMASGSLFLVQWWTTRQAITRDLRAQGQIIAANSTAALKFDDAQAATEILQALRAKPHILRASLHQPDGKILASYGAGGTALPPMLRPPINQLLFQSPYAELFQSVILNGERVGTLFMRFDVRSMERELVRPFLVILAGILAAALLSAYALSALLRPLISRPILRLAETARVVAHDRDYSVRAPPADRDEIGVLTQAFNLMLEEIQRQHLALDRSQQKMEALVHSIDGVVWECTPDTFQFTFVSRQSERLLGYTPDQWLAEPTFWQAHIHPEDRQRAVETCHQAVAQGAPYHYDYRMLAADGRVVWIRESGSLLLDKGHPVAIRGLFQDISAQKAAAAELERMNRQLLDISRQAGMAEVATGVLHNVGNVLNSVNVSATLLYDGLHQSKVASLPKLASLLESQAGDLAHFFSQDPRGRQIPGYIRNLADHLVQQQTSLLGEIEGLRKHIDHIKDIVAMQQNYAKIAGVVESVSPEQLLEDALQLNLGALERHKVIVEREYRDVPPITLEKHKALQILVNLIRNAKHALDEGAPAEKRLRLRVQPDDSMGVRIEVSDNGVGIAPENLARIFQHGFSTRTNGHGFGLHSGALAAKEMGGSLAAQSEGPGRGATFTLGLPLNPPPQR
jgi:PAS domain S-box-containing protein